ncbi:MAG: ComF family protein [Deltaproteobacteria bacterium]|jgi:predicted amidophosphoribosyltransferase|nr:ComF family protein [Deltaproteobacteria bacterium]
MEVDVKKINGVWDLGYSLDKHTISSTPIGYSDWGHMQYDTIRPEAGEALFQLKYRSDYTQVSAIASQMYKSIIEYFPFVSLIIPMPPSKQRVRQPVTEIARELGLLMSVPCFEGMLVKTIKTPEMKDIASREKKIQTLMDAFMINDQLGEGVYDVLLVDDLFDTGSSLEAATNVLRQYKKTRKVYVATVTRKR